MAPEKIFSDLFIAFHHAQVRADGKEITDAVPVAKPSVILEAYAYEKGHPDFDLKVFFEQWFRPQESKAKDFESDTDQAVEEHIEGLWDILYREGDEAIEGSSLLPLPKPYIVPGGRFNEIYYWDSYFTMLGLQISGKHEVIESMLDNFAWLIDEIGFIPNGNRTYFTGRSQPPFFACMVDLLAQERGEEIYLKYLSALLKEHSFWTLNAKELTQENPVFEHSVYRAGNKVLQRYYDRNQEPRAEMYGADIEELEKAGRDSAEFFLDVRAACESGWDFSSRWLEANLDLGTIHCADILPVDLNCLMWNLEKVIAKALKANGNSYESLLFKRMAEQRRTDILTTFWNTEASFFCDYNFVKEKLLSLKSLAGVFPLFFNIATQRQADACAKVIEAEFLKPGGVVTTNIKSGQQWDAPNGWAPLQWITVIGLRNYGHHELADQIKDNWLNLNRKVFKETGKMLEKYNVEDTSLLSGGGEYPVQDGFGWTNGVFLALLNI